MWWYGVRLHQSIHREALYLFIREALSMVLHGIQEAKNGNLAYIIAFFSPADTQLN
jgi:hypothetical protein